MNADADVVVCGAGAAGLAAALAAARSRASVLLVERSPQIGGTVAHALIHTLGGLYDAYGNVQNAGLPAELIDRLHEADPRTRRRRLGRTWVLNVCPNVYRAAVTRWIAEQPGINVMCQSQASRVVRRANRIFELEVTSHAHVLRFRPRAVIDATGTAELVRLLDPALVSDEESRAAGGWIFRLSGVAAGALDFPKGLAAVRALRSAAAAGELPPLSHHAWLDFGVDTDEVFVKLMVPLQRDWQDEAVETARRAGEAQAAIVHFLRRCPDFAQAEVTQSGSLGVRDGGRIRGRYTLTAEDVRRGRKFAEAAGRCSWPIEYWDAERGASVEYLTEGTEYDIPQAALQVWGVDNLWACGKCLSADRWAHASARVVGACWAMGQAAGIAAAACSPHPGQELSNQHEQPLPAIS